MGWGTGWHGRAAWYRAVSGSGPGSQSRILSRSTYSTFPHRYLSSITRCMTLSRARDPFAGINHWKRKHIPAATQICQHPTAGESEERGRERARLSLSLPRSNEWREPRGRQRVSERQGGRSVESGRETERERERRERVNKREIMTRPRPTGLSVLRSCTHCHGSESESWREREGERAYIRVSERERWKAERNERTRCSSVDDSSLPWGARATHTRPAVCVRARTLV